MKSLICTLFFLTGSMTLGASHTVTMKSISYEPKVLNIAIGDKVEWNNKSYTEHSATFEDSAKFKTGLIQPKKSSQPIVFDQAGSFHYHCSVHGKTMSGTIVVAEKK